MPAESARGDAVRGCVVAVDTGVLEVLTDERSERVVRATLDGCLLAEVARDRSALPAVGEWVWLRRWPDGHRTVLGRIGAPRQMGRVLPFRRR